MVEFIDSLPRAMRIGLTFAVSLPRRMLKALVGGLLLLGFSLARVVMGPPENLE